VVWHRTTQKARADFPPAQKLSSELAAVVAAAGPPTRVELHATFNGVYHNIFVNRPFLEACRSTGQLESRLLDAAAGG
jgi:hypothetical protein